MSNRIVHTLAHFFLISGTLLLWQGSSVAAPPSFELDPKELETAAPLVKAPKHPAGRTHRKQAARSDETGQAAVTEGDERLTRYTVKPGDFLFKILMREFGLSNAEAETLIPEVQRINHLTSATRLEVGRTLLVPRGKRKSFARKTTQPVSAPAAPPATEAAAPEPAPAARPLPPPPAAAKTPPPREPEVEAPSPAGTPVEPAERVKEPAQPSLSFPDVLLRLWEQLVPDQGRVEPITLGGRVLSPEEYPLLLAADGGRILVDLRGSLNGAAKSQLVQKYPDIRVLPRGSENFKEFFTDLLRTAEFARIEENPTVELGADPRLAVRADFRITALPAAGHGPESILIFVDENGPSLPTPLKEYLNHKGYRVAELSRKESPRADEPGYDLRFLPPAQPCEMVLSLLEILSLKLDRNRIVTGSMGQNAESRFSIRVDGLFETGGQRFILDCGENDSYNYTLYRLLQLQGYGIVQPQPKDDYATVTEKLMQELNYPFAFGRYDFDYGRYRISVTGFKITRRGDSSGRLLLVNKPSDPVFAELLQSAPAGK
ncbi:LysM peptidoglycan-binding domain-containing protein [Geobacter sp.]|uniref:LysM peptidoglycan-binding domain-containing protein n=1 Tax=Geobacter sp. TaxID=46610 RepID=UPI00261C7DE7|nr:LysM peptidoglycan-binding domain-containing protein [Geobacter sp.]